ncbi:MULTISPECIES: hypothetical protein [unclassified Microcoleus]|uniref:hypothetical protein n=1 Tax=unclassified Microcoleus TaxID=2642155 RepID=UPI002FD50696
MVHFKSRVLGYYHVARATGIDIMLDRAIRADANILFCGRSGKAFESQLQPTFINNLATTIDFQEPPATVSATARRAMEAGIMWGDSAIEQLMLSTTQAQIP